MREQAKPSAHFGHEPIALDDNKWGTPSYPRSTLSEYQVIKIMQVNFMIVIGCLVGFLQATTIEGPKVPKTPPTLIRVARQGFKERNPDVGPMDGPVLRKERSEGGGAFKFNMYARPKRAMSDQSPRRQAHF